MLGAKSLICLSLLLQAGSPEGTRQATGVKVGEVSDTAAVVWVRLTQKPERNADGIVLRKQKKQAQPLPPDLSVDKLQGACPGAPGNVRLRISEKQDLSGARVTDRVEVSAATDFSHQFKLTDLRPATTYYYAVASTGPNGTPKHDVLRGEFRTAPPSDVTADVTFTVVTGQAYYDLDHPEGYHIYPAMGRLNPDFIVLTGDTVYYDSEEPRATTEVVARHHWHRMYSLPRHVAFHLQVPGYWIKDDHDTVFNDCWPGDTKSRKARLALPMTFEKGQRLFREQVPMGPKTWRSYRWGKALEVWLVEGRDFRSPNNQEDGPGKTIWGDEQKRWLKRTILQSDADWKVLVSATPIVGPDRPRGKADNHSNAAFAHEGNEIREWFRKNAPDNFFIACGDRHWQYHSVHPDTGVHEFSCGPASDQHAGGSPGLDPAYHRFHRVEGGFLSVSARKAAEGSRVCFRFHDVHGKVVYEHTATTQGEPEG